MPRKYRLKHKRPGRKIYIAVMMSRRTGRKIEVKCLKYSETPEEYLIVRGMGYARSIIHAYLKASWAMVDVPKLKVNKKRGRPFKIKTEQPVIPAVLSAPEPLPIPDPEPTPLPEPEPVPAPLPIEVPDDGFSEADMALINDEGAKRVSSSQTGDLTKEMPGEYNARAKHEVIGAADLLMMKAKVDAEFALQEGQRKMKQAMVKRALQQRVEQTGVGCVPD